MTKTILIGLALASMAAAGPLYTISITSAGDSYQIITPAVQAGNNPDEYQANAFADNTNLKFWEEQTGVLVGGDIFVQTGSGVKDFLSNGYTKIPGWNPGEQLTMLIGIRGTRKASKAPSPSTPRSS